jgi:hypothetical protein
MSPARESHEVGGAGGWSGSAPPARIVALAWIGLLGAYALLAIGSCIVAAVVWGPWLDEFYSFYVTDPARPLGELWGYWVTDIHPFYFSFFTRALRALLPLSLIGLRLANLVPLLAILAMAGLYWRQDREGRLFVLLSLVLLLSSGALFDHFHDFRAYLTLLAASYGNALATVYLFRAPPARRVSIVLWLASAAVLANSHYLGTLFALLQSAMLAAILAAQGRGRLARGLAIGGAAMACPAVAYAVYQGGHILSKTGGRFWVKSTTGEALTLIGDALWRQTGFNLAAYAACLAAVAWAVGTGRFRPGRLAAALRTGTAMPALLAVIGAGTAFLLVLLLVNLHTPIFVARYLVPLNGPLCIAVSLAASSLGPSPRRVPLALLVLVNAAVVVGLARPADYRSGGQRWNATAAYIAGQVRACPTARVLAVTIAPAASPERSQLRLAAYRYLARRHGFEVTALVPPQAVASDPRGPCPELFWIEHLFGVRHGPGHAADWMRRLGIDFTSDPQRTSTFWGESGGVIVVAPAG